MSYTTYEILVSKYPGIAGKVANPAELVGAFIPGAEAEINGYLAAKYTVPFTTVPPLVQDLCTDLVYTKLTIRDPKLSEQVKKYYYERIKAILAGTLSIVQTDGTTLTNEASQALIDKEYHSRFGPDAPENWQPDSDELDDAEDARDGD